MASRWTFDYFLFLTLPLNTHTHMRLSLCAHVLSIQKPYWTANLLIDFSQIWKGIYIFYPKSFKFIIGCPGLTKVLSVIDHSLSPREYRHQTINILSWAPWILVMALASWIHWHSILTNGWMENKCLWGAPSGINKLPNIDFKTDENDGCCLKRWIIWLCHFSQ